LEPILEGSEEVEGMKKRAIQLRTKFLISSILN